MNGQTPALPRLTTTKRPHAAFRRTRTPLASTVEGDVASSACQLSCCVDRVLLSRANLGARTFLIKFLPLMINGPQQNLSGVARAGFFKHCTCVILFLVPSKYLFLMTTCAWLRVNRYAMSGRNANIGLTLRVKNGIILRHTAV